MQGQDLKLASETEEVKKEGSILDKDFDQHWRMNRIGEEREEADFH